MIINWKLKIKSKSSTNIINNKNGNEYPDENTLILYEPYLSGNDSNHSTNSGHSSKHSWTGDDSGDDIKQNKGNKNRINKKLKKHQTIDSFSITSINNNSANKPSLSLKNAQSAQQTQSTTTHSILSMSTKSFLQRSKNNQFYIDQSRWRINDRSTPSFYNNNNNDNKRNNYHSRSPSPSPRNNKRKQKKLYNKFINGHNNPTKITKTINKINGRHGLFPNGKVNNIEIAKQIKVLKQLFESKKKLSEIITIYFVQYGYCIDFIVYLISIIDITEELLKYINIVSIHVDKKISILHKMSIWQYIIRNQPLNIDIHRFFYSFGPLIGPYKNLLSPLHLSARKLIECGGDKESHITPKLSPPKCVYAFEIFKWLLFIGYDINDGDIDGINTPKKYLNQTPRILKQILWYQRQLLHIQRECMKIVEHYSYLDDDILQLIEKFTYKQYRKHTRFQHKKFYKNPH